MACSRRLFQQYRKIGGESAESAFMMHSQPTPYGGAYAVHMLDGGEVTQLVTITSFCIGGNLISDEQVASLRKAVHDWLPSLRRALMAGIASSSG